MAQLEPNPYVVYRVSRVQDGYLDPSEAWRVRWDGDTLTWLSFRLYDSPLYSEEGRVTITDDKHFRLERADGVVYEFYPLTLADFHRVAPSARTEADNDFELQYEFARLFGELDPKFYDRYVAAGGPSAQGFVDSDLVEAAVSESIESVLLREGAAAPVGTVRTWCSRRDGSSVCDEFEKLASGEWKRLPRRRHREQQPSERDNPHGIDVNLSSEDWIAADPLLPRSSKEAHTVPTPNGKYAYTSRRRALHAKILGDMFAGRKPSARPTAVFVMGPPASGKSVTRRLRSDMMDWNSVHIDPDDIRAQLPEFGQAIRKRARNAGSITYEEAQHLNNKAVERAMKKKFNFVMDAAGGTSDKGIEWFAKTMQDLKKKGYTVKVHMHVTPDADKLKIRSEDRGLRTGRFVPASMIDSAVARVPMQFSAYRDLVDEMAVYDTSGIDDDPPMPARKVFSKTPDSNTFDDPRFMLSHLGVTESRGATMTDWSDKIGEKLLQALSDEERELKKAPIIAKKGEGVTWTVFDPAFDSPDLDDSGLDLDTLEVLDIPGVE